MQVVLKLYEKRWVVDVREPLHNHRASDGPLVHPTIRRRARKANVQSVVKDAWEDGKSIKETVALLRRMWPHIPLIHRDVVNLRIRLKRRELAGRSSLQDLLHRLEQEDSDFLPYWTHDGENRADSALKAAIL
jgi:hypothetical protein